MSSRKVLAAYLASMLSVTLVPTTHGQDTVPAGAAAREFYRHALDRQEHGDFSGAIADYSRSIDLGLTLALVYEARGTARQASGDFAGALADFSRAIELDPQDARAYAARGEVKQALDDDSGAMADYGKAAELRPHELVFGQPWPVFPDSTAIFPISNRRDRRAVIERDEREDLAGR